MLITFLILPNHLFKDVSKLKQIGLSKVILMEEPMHFFDKERRPYNYNKCKLAYMRASLKFYQAYLAKVLPNLTVEYCEFTGLDNSKYPIENKVYMYEPHDVELNKKYQSIYPHIHIVEDTPMFLMSTADLHKYKGSVKHAPFLKYVKSRVGILETTPSLDKLNRAAMPRDIQNKLLAPHKYKTHWAQDSVEYIDNHAQFSNNIGDATSVCLYPCTHNDALKACRMFVKTRLRHFGKYQDAISKSHALPLFHSCLSAPLNNGLLTPKDVINIVMTHVNSNPGDIPMQSLEGFLRQLLGWREWCRYIYHFHHTELSTSNTFNCKNRLHWDNWMQANTGVPLLDNEIKKATKYAYAHHIIRLMVFLNVMVLCSVRFADVKKWFMQVCAIDAWDWVMVSNIGAMGFYSHRFMTRPYLSSSAYWRRMSDYPSGEWAGSIDAIFRDFIRRNRTALRKYGAFYTRHVLSKNTLTVNLARQLRSRLVTKT
jgi:deoxyribodipyrimidine photolyase-related protein